MSQKQKILNHLLEGKTLTPLEALQKFGCFRLGARIFDLRAEGYMIDNIGPDEANYAVYQMIISPPHCVFDCPPVLPPAFKPVANKPQSLFA